MSRLATPLVLGAVALAAAAPISAQTNGAAAGAEPYVVLCAVPPGDPYRAAAERLAAHRRAALHDFDPADLAPVEALLRDASPRWVAIVLKPDQLDFPFARAFLQLAARLDDDPFVDFAHGFVTGATAADAVAFVDASIAAATKGPQKVKSLAQVAGGMPESQVVRQPYLLRKSMLPCLHGHVAGGEKHPQGRDRAFTAGLLPQLDGVSALTFAGHGMPDEVVGGPDAADLADLKLPGAVVLNVACYTGVTSVWFEDDWRARKVVRRVVPPERSFCLRVLKSGAIGYTAYTCPRPAGPELDTDLTALIANGDTLGDARRRDYDKTVLGFLGFGEAGLALAEVRDGDPLRQGGDVVREMMLEGATGGVLFGDPALAPFTARPGDSPVQFDVQHRKDAIEVVATCGPQALWLQCSDPTAMFDGEMAMRVYARVPLGSAWLAGVTVDLVEVGGREVPTRRVFAQETDRGERFAQVKVLFRRAKSPGKLSARFTIATTADPAKAVLRGGDVTKARRAPPPIDLNSTAVTEAMAQVAARDGVPRAALEAALAATAASLTDLDAAACKDALTSHGPAAFAALCALLECGHHHWRTADLLGRTYTAGAEAKLFALAARDDLPNYAAWTVLDGLGVADTERVREYLRGRLADDQDAGLFMAAAKGLARLRDAQSVARIGALLLERREDWQSVAHHLAAALAAIGGADAERILAKHAESR